MNRDDEQIELIVSKALHEAIVGFDPESPESYHLHSVNLESLEEQIQGVEAQDLKNSLLTRTKACIIGMAHDAGRSNEVILRSEEFLRTFSPSDPDFVSVALFRVHALHQQERHEEEAGDAIALARGGLISGEALVLMLERLVRDHPGVLSCDEAIADRIENFLERQSGLLIEGLERPVNAAGLESSIIAVAHVIRERSRVFTEQCLLNDGRPDD